jgi:hypothetical protein
MLKQVVTFSFKAAPCTIGTGHPFPGGKARPGRDADHSPPSNAEVVNEQELYFLSPCASIGVLWDCFTFTSFRWLNLLGLIRAKARPYKVLIATIPLSSIYQADL